MSTVTLATKRCTKCGQRRPLAEFGRNGEHRDGLQSWCKACHRVHARLKRATDPARKDRDARQRHAYSAAEARLRVAHRDEFDRYYADELTMRGLA